jgi:hypothetical protein
MMDKVDMNMKVVQIWPGLLIIWTANQFHPCREVSVHMWATDNGSSILFVLTVTSISIMSAGDVPSSVAQCIIMHLIIIFRLLCNKVGKATDIYYCLRSFCL